MKDRLEQVLKKFSSQCDYLEVHIEETEESRVQFTGPQLTDLGKKVDFGGNVRALNKGGWGFASFNSVGSHLSTASTASMSSRGTR